MNAEKNKNKHLGGGGKKFKNCISTMMLVILFVQNITLQVEICSLNKKEIDTIQNVRLLNLERFNLETDAVIHFSIDDVIEIFRDLTKNQDQYQSIFENSTLNYLNKLHEQYGMVVTLYCFYEFAGFSLDECTDRFAEEFSENKEWLKFGFHAYNQESYRDKNVERLGEHYKMVSEQLQRITGCEETDLSKVLRLDRFSGTQEQLLLLAQRFGIKAFLTADDGGRKSYYLEDEASVILAEQDFYKDGNIVFTPTDIRLENIEDVDNLDSLLEEHQGERNLVIFTHEWKFDQKAKTLICQIAEYGIKRQYRFSDEVMMYM